MRDIVSFVDHVTARRLVLPGTGGGLKVASQNELSAALLALARLCASPSSAYDDDGEKQDGLSFSLKSVGYYQASRTPFFETAGACQEATQVFARWGVSIVNYFGSLEEFFGAWLVLCGHAADLARKLAVRGRTVLEDSIQKPLDSEYLQAVVDGDHGRAAALFGISSFPTLIEREIAAARLDLMRFIASKSPSGAPRLRAA